MGGFFCENRITSKNQNRIISKAACHLNSRQRPNHAKLLHLCVMISILYHGRGRENGKGIATRRKNNEENKYGLQRGKRMWT